MTADPIHIREREVVAVRIRLSTLGRVKLQMQRRLVRLRFLEDKVLEEPAGKTDWKNAERLDAIEAALFLERLQNGM